MSEEPPGPRVLISNRQDLPFDRDDLAATAVRTLEAEGVDRGELSVSFVTPEEMTALHERFAGEPGPTDVLSFPQDETDEVQADGVLLGDVVVCPAVAAEQADDLAAELRVLLVHGVLHLLGYDHEAEADRAEMWARQDRHAGAAG